VTKVYFTRWLFLTIIKLLSQNYPVLYNSENTFLLHSLTSCLFTFGVDVFVNVLGDKKVFVCLSQGAACPEPSTVFVDLRALRNDRVTLVEKGSPHSLCLMESGKVGQDLLSYIHITQDCIC